MLLPDADAAMPATDIINAILFHAAPRYAAGDAILLRWLFDISPFSDAAARRYQAARPPFLLRWHD